MTPAKNDNEFKPRFQALTFSPSLHGLLPSPHDSLPLHVQVISSGNNSLSELRLRHRATSHCRGPRPTESHGKTHNCSRDWVINSHYCGSLVEASSANLKNKDFWVIILYKFFFFNSIFFLGLLMNYAPGHPHGYRSTSQ